MDTSASSIRKRRVFRQVEEKLRIVKLALEPGASVASVALANGVNANQVFRWKRQYERGDLQPRRSNSATALVPVRVAEDPRPQASDAPSLPACHRQLKIPQLSSLENSPG